MRDRMFHKNEFVTSKFVDFFSSTAINSYKAIQLVDSCLCVIVLPLSRYPNVSNRLLG